MVPSDGPSVCSPFQRAILHTCEQNSAAVATVRSRCLANGHNSCVWLSCTIRHDRNADMSAQRIELPLETPAYVLDVTGYPVTEWTMKPIPDLFGERSCADLLANLKIKSRTMSPPFESPLDNPEWKPWGVQLAGNWHLGLLLASFERIRRHYPSIIGETKPYIRSRLPGVRVANFAVRLMKDSRQEADQLCAQLEAVGGACAVLRNPRP